MNENFTSHKTMKSFCKHNLGGLGTVRAKII